MNKSNSLKNMIFASLFCAITIVTSYIIIPLPFSPVPVTAQTLSVMLAGNLLPAKTGFFSMVLYIFMGLIGLPVFSGGKSGIAALIGPTGGYIISWPIAVFVMGLVLERVKVDFSRLLLINILFGVLLVDFIGIIYLSFSTNISLLHGFTIGVLPFLIGDITKAVMSAIIALAIRKNVVLLNKKNTI